MRRFIIILILCYSASCFAQQNVTWVQKSELKVKVQKCLIDPLNRIYLIRKGEIELLDENDKKLTTYSNKLIGENIILDVSNPLKLLLFSPDQMQLIFLDSRLAELREPVNLFVKGFEQISLAATSHSNGFWLYDPINFKLIRFDQNLEKERESLNIGQLLRLEFNPTNLVEQGNKVYCTDPAHGIFVFDVYGNYLNKLPIKGIENLTINNDRIFYKKGGILYVWNLKESIESQVGLELANSNFFDVNRSRIIYAENNRVLIFTTRN